MRIDLMNILKISKKILMMKKIFNLWIFMILISIQKIETNKII